MRRYESVVILDPDVTDDDVRQFTERYTSLIKDNGGEIIKVGDWGKKRLAYLVKKRDMGRYILLDYVAPPEVIIEVERNFKIDEQVLKYLSVKMDDDVDLEAFKAQAEEEEAKAKAESAAAEAPEEKPEAAPATDEPAQPEASESSPEPEASEKASEEKSEEAPTTEEPTKSEAGEKAPEAEATDTTDPKPESSDEQPTDESEQKKEEKSE
jgi:small subunit ribosomal protein S6